MKPRNKQPAALTFVCLVFMLLAAGCGQREINDLAIVSAVGLDKTESGAVRVTAQIVRSADARGQTGAPAGNVGEPIYSVSAEGKTIFEAIRNLARFSSRRVYWAHNFVIVMNEGFAREGIKDMVDFFTRNHELRMETWVVVTPDPASRVVSTVTGLEVVPGEAVNKLFRYNEIVAEAPRTNMMRLEESFVSETTQPVLAKLRLKQRGISNKKPEEHGSLEQVELSGAGVFKDGRFVGWLSPAETRGMLFFIENIDSGVVAVPCPHGAGGYVSLELKKQRFKLVPRYKDGIVSFTASAGSEADMVESGCAASLYEMRADLERGLERELTDNIRAAVQAAQKTYESDFLKLGEVFRNQFPAEWRAIGSDWGEQFMRAQVDVQVKAVVNSPVLKVEERSFK